MKITKRQLRRIIKEELVREGFLDWAAEKVGDAVGINVSRAKSMEDAESDLSKAIATYAMSLIGPEGGVKEDMSNLPEMSKVAFEKTKSKTRELADAVHQHVLKQQG